jgi:hypothetical protein
LKLNDTVSIILFLATINDVCLYFYFKATPESKKIDLVFGEWAKRVGRNLKRIVGVFRLKKIDERSMMVECW